MVVSSIVDMSNISSSTEFLAHGCLKLRHILVRPRIAEATQRASISRTASAIVLAWEGVLGWQSHL